MNDKDFNNDKKYRRYRIGIDARLYGPIGKGLGRYIQEISDKIIGIDKNQNCEFVIFLNPDNYDELVVNRKNVKKVLVKIPWYGLKEQFYYPYLIWREKLDLIHFPHFNVPLFLPCPFIVTIHDLILIKFPSRRASTLSAYKYWFKYWAYRLVISSALKRAKRVIAVSQFTKKDIIKYFGIKEEKIMLTYEGVANLDSGQDSLFVAKLDEKEVLDIYNISGQFLLYVGNAYPHKNLDFLLSAFSKLRTDYPNLKLVLVGKEDYFYQLIKIEASRLNLWQKDNFNSPVIFAGYVPDRQLKVLYQRALAYVFPSQYEGFGLPPLEAMANNCPVLSSNRGSLPEVLGKAALYFSPDNQVDFIFKLKKLLSDNKLRQELITQGQKQAKAYDWWECAYQTWKIYCQVLRETVKNK